MNTEKSLKLFGLDNYFDELISTYNNNNFPNKILFTGRKGIGKINIEEKQTGTVNAGLSIGTIEGFAILAGLNERNLFIK